MTDRHAGYIVTLDNDIREDDAEATLAALKQIKGVLAVDPIVADHNLHMAESRAKHEVRMNAHYIFMMDAMTEKGWGERIFNQEKKTKAK